MSQSLHFLHLKYLNDDLVCIRCRWSVQRFKARCCHHVLSYEDRCGAIDYSGLGAFQTEESTLSMLSLYIPLQSSQASSGILAGCMHREFSIERERGASWERCFPHNTQFSGVKSICSDPTMLCSSQGSHREWWHCSGMVTFYQVPFTMVSTLPYTLTPMD